MPGGPSYAVEKDLHTLFHVGTAGGLTDGQLLEEFLRERDDVGEAAFSALVMRHAPMVLRICHHVLGDWHEAEDASQATFIVLARKAGSIHKRASIASWLFGVARRVAAQAKAKTARRRRHEERSAELVAAKVVQGDPHVPWFELYEEIDRLPEKLRGPVVLCYLKGHSQPEAAARPGCPVRTLQNRLAQAQERLRCRLTNRGLQPAVGLSQAFVGWRGASDPMATRWLEQTVRAAVASTRHASIAELASASVASLTEGTLAVIFRTNLKSIVAGVFVIAALTVGCGLLAIRTAGAPPPEGRKDETAKVASRSFGDEIVVRAVDNSRDRAEEGFTGMAAIDPDTGKWRPIYKGLAFATGRVSPDGRYSSRSSRSRPMAGASPTS